MKQENDITVLSTFALDTLIDETGRVLGTQEGGPAYYLKRVFEDEEISYLFVPSPKMGVEILLTDKGEFGRVPNVTPAMRVGFSEFKTPYIVISTILDEFNLSNISDFKGKAFLDIQGYIRDGKNFGKKKELKDIEILDSAFCLKGTQEELRYIPAHFLEDKKIPLVLITRGERGCEVFYQSVRYEVRPEDILKPEHTIGAGDTFFGYFISQFIKREDPLASAQYATKKTSLFLSSQFK